jgi:hypothetical protein
LLFAEPLTRSVGAAFAGRLRRFSGVFAAPGQIVKPDEIDISAFAVTSNLEKIDHSKEARLARQLRSNVRKTDGLDGVHFDFACLHPIPPAYLNMRTCPDAYAARDFSSTNAIPQTPGERHSQPRAIFATLLRGRRPSGNGATAAKLQPGDSAAR